VSGDVPFVLINDGDAPVLDRVGVSMSFTIWRTEVRLYDVAPLPPPSTARGGVDGLGR
jgi:CRISPR-associated Cas5-like protein